MTIKQCDRCGKTIDEGIGFQRYKIFDCCPENSGVLIRSIGSTQNPMTPLDLCSECYNKLIEFTKNEDVSRSYRIRQGGDKS